MYRKDGLLNDVRLAHGSRWKSGACSKKVKEKGNRKKNDVRREAMHLYPGSIDIVGGT